MAVSESPSRGAISASSVPLDGPWRFRSADGAADDAVVADAATAGTAGEWLSGEVPGRVHADLLRLGLIADPRVGTNSRDCVWVDDKDWWYCRQFVVPGGDAAVRRAELVFDGLDTIASVYLNGRLVGTHADMFIPCTFEVTDVVLYDAPNTLAIKFSSVLRTYADREPRGVVPRERAPAFYARRCFTGFSSYLGAAPYLVGAGVWRSARLVLSRGVRIVDVYARTALSPAPQGNTPAEVELKTERADLTLEVTLRNDTSAVQDVAVAVSIDGDTLWEDEVSHVTPGTTTTSVQCSIAKPKLWWPHTLGAPHLYEITITTTDGQGRVDSWSQRIGVRTVDLVQNEDGESRFYFRFNGIRTFLKGAGWVPPDGLTLHAPVETYRRLLEMARDANMNLVRDWSGGIIERPEFFDICDELGIVVWQDFMLECIMRPDWDQEFLDQVAVECAAEIRMLRNHPSIALWCGGNESFMGWDMWSWRDDSPRMYGADIYLKLISDLCASLDPTRPYWPNSPYGGGIANSTEMGDVHDYSWNDFMSIGDARFISEIGRIAPPALKSMEKAIPADELWPIGEAWTHYNGQLPNARVRGTYEYGPITNVEEYIRFTQLGQAEYLAEQARHFRARKFHCGGYMIWRLNDPWPNCGMSVVDALLEPKIGYYKLRRAYADPLVFLAHDPAARHGGAWQVWGVTDRPETLQAQVEIALYRYAGPLVWSRRLPVTLRGNSALVLATVPWSDLPAALSDVGRCVECLAARLWVDGTPTDWTIHHFAPYPLRRLEPSQLTVEPWSREDGSGTLVLRASNFVELVELASTAEISFDDNYFDLLLGEPKSVRWRSTGSAHEAAEPVAVRVRARNTNPVLVEVT
jgi:beta-mannosidase